MRDTHTSCMAWRIYESTLIKAVTLLLFALYITGCSSLVTNKVADAVASGGNTYASDDDPELIRAATPFSLKLTESLLSQSPRHQGLLLAAASGFTQYTYAFVQQDADVIEDQDVSAAAKLHNRARRLYIRARDYGLRGLDAAHPGLAIALRSNPTAALRVTSVDDVALLYWTAVSWAAAISLSKDNPELLADLPAVDALIYRALELNESFNDGAIHVFLISYEMGRPGSGRDTESRAAKHFERALELTQGQQVAPYVAFAEAVCVANQNRAEFQVLLQRALAVNAEAAPQWRLANVVMQRRARWLLQRTDQLFSQ
ncbi:MAG TPA: TRAP transporter TatT component family protein [Burkholderiales bacterium]|nr:TRAP transporter TatT component family protein [Burkholderiales bacterium]